MIDDDASGAALFVKAIRYLILNYAMPLNGYLLEKYQMIVSYVIYSR